MLAKDSSVQRVQRSGNSESWPMQWSLILMLVNISTPNVVAYCYRLGRDYDRPTKQTDRGPRCADGRLKNQNGPGYPGRQC